MFGQLTSLFGGGLGAGGGPSSALGGATGGTSVQFGNVSKGASTLQLLIGGAVVVGVFFFLTRKK